VAVPPPRVVPAVLFKDRTREQSLKDELAVWDRAGLVVDRKETAMNMTVTIASPGEDEKVVCATGKDEAGMGFIARLRQPVARDDPQAPCGLDVADVALDRLHLRRDPGGAGGPLRAGEVAQGGEKSSDPAFSVR
jgi:hypothetical protein